MLVSFVFLTSSPFKFPDKNNQRFRILNYFELSIDVCTPKTLFDFMTLSSIHIASQCVFPLFDMFARCIHVDVSLVGFLWFVLVSSLNPLGWGSPLTEVAYQIFSRSDIYIKIGNNITVEKLY